MLTNAEYPNSRLTLTGDWKTESSAQLLLRQPYLGNSIYEVSFYDFVLPQLRLVVAALCEDYFGNEVKKYVSA